MLVEFAAFQQFTQAEQRRLRREACRKAVGGAEQGHAEPPPVSYTHLRLAIGILWIVLVPCEMLGVSAGLGYYILDTRDRLAYSELMAMVLLIGLLGYLLDAAARGLYRRWAHGALG